VIRRNRYGRWHIEVLAAESLLGTLTLRAWALTHWGARRINAKLNREAKALRQSAAFRDSLHCNCRCTR
jgi:hypothetical protein